MAWNDRLTADALPWLLKKDDPGPRYRAMRDVLGLPEDDPELRRARRAAHARGPIAAILAAMDPAGYWETPGPGYNPKYRSSVWSLILLAELGARIEEDRRLATATTYILDHALAPGGQFTASGAPSGTADCLQGNLLWALVELGSHDDRLRAALDWMARSVTGEGIAPAGNRTATVRYYAGKYGPTFACGSNLKQPCAWGGVKVMLALGRFPGRPTPVVKRAIARGGEFLLAGDPAGARYPTTFSNRPSRNWWKFGFPVFYVTDLLQNVEALAAAGFARDPRLARAIDLIYEKQDTLGRWSLDYDYAGKTWVDFGRKNEPNKWVTLRALRTLKAVG